MPFICPSGHGAWSLIDWPSAQPHRSVAIDPIYVQPVLSWLSRLNKKTTLQSSAGMTFKYNRRYAMGWLPYFRASHIGMLGVGLIGFIGIGINVSEGQTIWQCNLGNEVCWRCNKVKTSKGLCAACCFDGYVINQTGEIDRLRVVSWIILGIIIALLKA